MSSILKSTTSTAGTRNRSIAVILLLPAIFASLILQYDPPAVLDLFAYGGLDVFVYNLCILILTPYFVVFLLALGDLYVTRLPAEDLSPLKRADLRLITFFIGCGTLTLLGFILGLLKLLYFWACFPIFVIVIYFYFLQSRSRETEVDLWNWMRGHESNGSLRFAGLILRIVLIAVVVSIMFSKGILIELFKDGGLHQYFAYFAETRLNHSIWMDPNHPMLYDYLAGRGQGVLLFFTSFTDQFTIQIIGAIYLIMIGVIARQVIELMVSIIGPTDEKPYVRSLLPDLVMLLALTSPILDMETARFHLQTGAFFLFLAWAGSLFLVLEGKQNRWLYLSLIPVVLAFPISSGIFYAFVGWILGNIIVSLVLTRRSATLKYPFLLLGFGAISAFFSFLLNWLYVGIPELQPSSVFIPLIWMEPFQQWSSMGLIYYLDSSLGQTVSSSSISIYKITLDFLALFSYPLNLLAKRVDVPPFLLSYYPILIIIILIWIAVLYLSNRNAAEERVQPTRTYFGYWLTFTSFYILRFLLTSFVQQASLKRMLLFMDIIPIITFFSLVIFLLDIWDRKSQDMDLHRSIKYERGIAAVVSILWGGSFALALGNQWPYFWQRSLPVQFLLITVLLIAMASLFLPLVKRVLYYFKNLPVNKKLILIAILPITSMVLTSILSSFTPISPYVPVPHTLKISVIEDLTPASRSDYVKLVDVIIDDKAVELKSLETSGDWVRQAGAMQGHDQAAMTYVFKGAWNSTVEMIFEYDVTAGSVQVEYDEHAPIVQDLYAAERAQSSIFSVASVSENKTSSLLSAFLFGTEFIVILGFLLTLTLLLDTRDGIHLRNLAGRSTFAQPLIKQISFVSSFLFLLFALTLTFSQLRVNLGFGKLIGSWQYFTGTEGAIKAYGPVITYGLRAGDRSDVFHCLEILKQVPGSAQVLNLNGFAAVEPCLFSPLLPRDKIVHHYEAVVITEPYYQTLMFGEPQAAYQIYRDLGINYFYLRKNDAAFVNLGYSRAFEPQNLEQYLDVYAEADDFYILTWRGEGLYPVSVQLEAEIADWYDDARDKKYNPLAFWWLGREHLEDWTLTQP